jgi:serine phosphatase RsbU (regulator of sigma subunit)
MGLRGKSLLALVLASVLALLPLALVAWQVVENVREHFGQVYARNLTQLNREKILAPVSRELALSKRLSDSVVTRQWMLAEDDPVKRPLFFQEAEGYRQDFRDQSYFAVVHSSLHYYFSDAKTPDNRTPHDTLRPGDPNNDWYFSSMKSSERFNINVDFDKALNLTKVWINVKVRDGDRDIGLAGTGIDLTRFLQDFIRTDEPGVTPMLLNHDGLIQAHPDHRLIALNSGTHASTDSDTEGLYALLSDKASKSALHQVLHEAELKPESVAINWVVLDGRRQLLAVSYIPELKWHVVTAIDLHAAHVIDAGWVTPVLAGLFVLLAVMLLAYSYVVDRLVLRPLRHLHQSAQAISTGNYDVSLPTGRTDELGELSRAFRVMADMVRANTATLESRVQERTRDLEEANREMAAAHKKIDDSIGYASLIQHAMLPSRLLDTTLGKRHSLLWRPRDVVGGDFYVYRVDDQGCLFGVVDCAGHGVPGALMTMLAHAAIEQAILQTGLSDPAAILARVDQIVRVMLSDANVQAAIATNMDMGLAYVDLKSREVVFAGAKTALYYSDGDSVGELAGSRRAIGDRRPGSFSNARVALEPTRTFYMTTDGFLDQAGGERGYSFGNSRFSDMIRKHARLPLAEQGEVFNATLAAYQGDHAQRDDITMLCFRFD